MTLEVSTVMVREAPELVCPAASVAFTVRVCSPSLRGAMRVIRAFPSESAFPSPKTFPLALVMTSVDKASALMERVGVGSSV